MIESQKLGTITPDQIKGVLSENAIDMNNRYTRGFDKGFDYNTGHGFIQADELLVQFDILIYMLKILSWKLFVLITLLQSETGR
jgi:hypothetical protein